MTDTSSYDLQGLFFACRMAVDARPAGDEEFAFHHFKPREPPMKLKKWLLSFALVLSGVSAQAAPVWVNGVTIKSIYPYGDGSFVISLSSAPASCTNAVTPDKYFYITVNAAPNGTTITQTWARNLLAVALQASALGNSVDVLFDSATTNCYVQAMIMHN